LGIGVELIGAARWRPAQPADDAASAEKPRGVLQDVGCDGTEQDHAGYLGGASYEHLRDAVMALLMSVREFD